MQLRMLSFREAAAAAEAARSAKSAVWSAKASVVRSAKSAVRSARSSSSSKERSVPVEVGRVQLDDAWLARVYGQSQNGLLLLSVWGVGGGWAAAAAASPDVESVERKRSEKASGGARKQFQSFFIFFSFSSS